MGLSIASAAVIAALFLSLSVNADRSLRNAGSNQRPNWFGYFVGLLCCHLALAALYECTVTLRQLDSPGVALLLLGTAGATTYGIVRRRRLGWVLLGPLRPLSPASFLAALDTEVEATVASAGALCMLSISAGYAMRWW